MLKRRDKKSQSEIIGLIIIIVLVLVAGVVFLGIYLRGDSGVLREDAEMKNFLTTSSKYTSSCYRTEETKFKTLGELIGDCYSLRLCSDGKSSCQVLQDTYGTMLKTLKESNSFGLVNYYKLGFYFSQNISDLTQRTPISGLKDIEEGVIGKNCRVQKTASNSISMGSEGDVIVELAICKDE